MSTPRKTNCRNRRWVGFLTAGLIAAGAIACGDEQPADEGALSPAVELAPEHHTTQEYRDSVDGPHADHQTMKTIVIPDAATAEDYFDDDGVAQLEYPDRFRQVGLQLDAASVDELDFRVLRDDGSWSEWEPVQIYWSKGIMHNGHILLDEATTAVELSGLEGLEFAQIEFFEEVIARDEIVGPDHDPAPPEELDDGDDVGSIHQAVAPSSMVTSRSEWGATSPNKVCGSVVAPYRASIHHTASPSSDGGNPHARMQGMQTYHMNTLGWCDIGYHFVVAQSGEIMQGRSHSDRPAAHVGGQNSGNVGISMIGNYTSSTPPSVQIENTGKILGWVHDTHGVALNRDAVRGHREWPGQSTSCPGNQGLNQIDDIISIAAEDNKPEPEPANYDVDVDITIEGLDSFYEQGTSELVPDAFAGETFTAYLDITNHSDEPIRDVAVGYGFGAGVQATSYQIETDHPEYDQSSWQLNDANDHPDNPSPGSMGSDGTLELYAFSPNETKRIAVELEATSYNIGFGDRPGVRLWMRNIKDVYGGGTSSYGSEPDTNHIGDLLREYQRIDVLSRSEWQFQAGHSDDLEGWEGEQHVDQLALNTNDDALALKAADTGASVVSPDWTWIDADTYDELVLTARSHDGLHDKVLYWRGDGEEFSEERSVSFEAPGDTEYHTLVVPVGDHPDWSGDIAQLRLVHPDDLVPGEAESAWYDVDHIYFQDQAAGVTSSDHLDLATQTPVSIDFDAGQEPGAPDSSVDNNGDSDSDSQPAADPWVDAAPFSDDPDDVEVHGSGGCSAAGTDQAPGMGVVFALLLLGFVALRRNDGEGQQLAS